MARIEYTIEKRGQAYRKTIECAPSRVDAKLAELEEKNAYSCIVSYEI